MIREIWLLLKNISLTNSLKYHFFDTSISKQMENLKNINSRQKKKTKSGLSLTGEQSAIPKGLN